MKKSLQPLKICALCGLVRWQKLPDKLSDAVKASDRQTLIIPRFL